jgi:hypothetical protein
LTVRRSHARLIQKKEPHHEEGEPMGGHQKATYGALALGLCLGGPVVAVTIGLIARLLGYDPAIAAYLVFLGFEICAFVLGMASRREVLGKTAYIASALLGVLSIGLIA